MTLARRNIFFGLKVSVCLFAIVNFAHFRKPASCTHCDFERGLPFTFLHAGGEGSGFVWPGVAEDFLVVLVIALVAASTLPWLKRKL